MDLKEILRDFKRFYGNLRIFRGLKGFNGF